MLSRLCIGTAQFGLDYGIANTSGRPGPQEISCLLAMARERRLSLIDTAQAYGNAEELLGAAMAELGLELRVVTKLHPNFVFSKPSDLEESIRGSLKRLRLERLEGLLLHRPEGGGDRAALVAAMADVKRRGLVKHFGVSVYTPEEACAFAASGSVDLIQVPFNLLDRRLLDAGFFELAQRENIGVYLRSVFLQGLLCLDDLAALERRGLQAAIPHLERLRDYAGRLGLSSQGFALKGAWQTVPTAKLIVGVETLAQLADNCALLSGHALSTADLAAWWDALPVLPLDILDCRRWTALA